MKVAAQKVVSIEYTLKDAQGEVLDTSQGRAPLAYLHGAQNIVVGLEKALEGAEVGAELDVTVAPEEGYGNYDPKGVQNVPVRKLPDPRPKVGSAVRLQTTGGPRVAWVKSVRGDYAALDMNHPLAGKTLHFKVKVVDVRDANAEELSHGHVHNPDDPHH